VYYMKCAEYVQFRLLTYNEVAATPFFFRNFHITQECVLLGGYNLSVYREDMQCLSS
jgi:hypothetical protein